MMKLKKREGVTEWRTSEMANGGSARGIGDERTSGDRIGSQGAVTDKKQKG